MHSLSRAGVYSGAPDYYAHIKHALARAATAFHVQAPSGPPVLPDMKVGKGWAWLTLASRQNSPRPSKAAARRIEQCLTFTISTSKVEQKAACHVQLHGSLVPLQGCLANIKRRVMWLRNGLRHLVNECRLQL